MSERRNQESQEENQTGKERPAKESDSEIKEDATDEQVEKEEESGGALPSSHSKED